MNKESISKLEPFFKAFCEALGDAADEMEARVKPAKEEGLTELAGIMATGSLVMAGLAQATAKAFEKIMKL